VVHSKGGDIVKWIKSILIFLAGFVTGVIAVNLYELFGIPAMPEDDYHEWTEDELLGIDKLFTPDELASLEDTQPIYIGESDDTITGYELYIWNGESE
jgi:hypothetical protein